MWRLTLFLLIVLAACQPAAPRVVRTNTPEPPTEPPPGPLQSGEALVLVEGDFERPSLAALDMASGDVRILMADTGRFTDGLGFDELPARSPDGTMVAFARQVIEDIPGGQEIQNDGIWVMNVDGSRPRFIAKPDAPEDGEAFENPAWSPDGTRIAFRNTALRSISVVSVEGGEITELLPFSFQTSRVAWSPDGERLLYLSERRDETGTLRRGLYVYDLETETETPIVVDEEATFQSPAWSANGERITYIRWDFEAELQEVYVSNADGSDAVNLTPGQPYAYDPQFSPDGTQIAYNHWEETPQGSNYSIRLLTLDGSAEPRTLLEVGANDRGPDW